jgi:serralysin
MCTICSISQTFDPFRHDTNAPLFQRDTSGLTVSEISGATSVAVGSTTSGYINSGGEQDVFAVTLEAGQAYQIDSLGLGANEGTLSDGDLHLYDSAGNYITYDDYNGAGNDASIVFTATTTGTYYIMVDSYNSFSSGTYKLAIEETVAVPPSGSEGSFEELAEYIKHQGNGSSSEITTTSSTITVNIDALTDLGQQMARWAMDAWEMVANVDFQIVSSGEMVTVDDLNAAGAGPGYQAWAYLGARGNTNGIEMMVSESWFDFGTTLDSYAFQTYVHEFGHILGLNHLGPYNGSADWGQDNYFSNDSWQVSVMSYFSQTDNPNTSASFGYAMGPMMADILAIQDLYGAPGASGVTAGNTVYGLNSNLGNYLDDLFTALATGTTSSIIAGNNIAITLYDQGGTDLIDLSFATASQTVSLNMNGGTFSDFATRQDALAIAVGTVIENARGGAAGDTVLGNAANNHIEGNGGNDILDGAAGNDLLDGGTGNDTLIGGIGDDKLTGGSGRDSLSGGTGADLLIGGGQNDTLAGGDGGDVFIFSTTSGEITDYAYADTAVDDTSFGGDVIALENATDYSITTSGGYVMIGNLRIQSTSATGNIAVLMDSGTGISTADNLQGISREGLSFVVHDTGTNEAFDRKIYTFAANNELSQIVTQNDDGSSIRAIYDALSDKSWASIESYLNASGDVYDHRVNYDALNQIRTITDVDSSAAWNTILEYRNAGGDLYDKRTNYDDDSQLRVIFDTDASKVWNTVLEYRNTSGDFYDKRTNYDDGSQLRVIFDTDSSQVWDTVFEYRDSAGAFYDKRTNYDDGSQLRVIFDTDGDENWATILEYRDSNGVFYDKRTNYDDGGQLRVIFDTDSSASWDTVLEYRNAANDLYQKTFNYDNGNRQVTVFDIDDSEIWDSYVRIYDSNDNLLSESYV